MEQWEQQGRTPRELWKKCGDLGLFGIHYPKAFGGMEADFTYSLILGEEMGGCGSSGTALGLSVQCDMATPALAHHGSDFLRDKYLTPSIKGDLITAIAVTEPGFGSNVAGIKTRAVLDGDHYVINGSKTFITNGCQADWICALVRTSDQPGYQGLSLFVIPTDLEGFSKGKTLKKTCYLSSDTAELFFEDLRVPATHLIGKEGMGFRYQMEQFQMERLSAVILALGAVKRSYELTCSYVKERDAFGRPLIGHQVTRHKLAQIVSEINMLESFTHRCVVLANEGKDFTRDVSMLKLVMAQALVKLTEECIQLHGGYGLMQEYEVSRYYRDAKLLGIGGGTNEVMKEIISKTEGWLKE